MKRYFSVLTALSVFFISGCSTVSTLERVKLKAGEGKERIYPVPAESIEPLVIAALEKTGLVYEKTVKAKEYRQVLSYSEGDEFDYGALFGIYLFPLTNGKTKVLIIKRNKFAVQMFARDYTSNIFENLDKLAAKQK